VIQFLSAHLKSILTVGFAIGLFSLFVKFLDEGLSATKKNRIDRWVNEAAPRLRAMTTDDFLMLAKPYKIWIMVISAALLLVASDIWLFHPQKFTDFLGSIVLVAVPSYLGMSWVFDAPTIAKMKFRVGLAVGGTVILGSLGLLLISLSSQLGVLASAGFVLLAPALMGLPFTIAIALATLTYFLLLGPVLAVARLLSWLSLYPKGPWAGIVALLTFGLGILRLFL
jgi:hypothetical protein